MVNKIDGNGYYDYAKPKKMNISSTGEKFSLGDKKDGLQTELKDKSEVSGQEKQQAAERDGVRIELSSQGVEKQKQAETVEHPNASGRTSLLETIRTFFTTAVAAVKDIFNKIWNDPQQEDDLKDIPEITDAPESAETADVTEDTESAETTGIIKVTENIEMTDLPDTEEDAAALRTDEEEPEREIRKCLRDGDLDQAIRLLTDNGRKTAARNSTLLTFYDKNRRVVKLDASVQQRALYGDKNTLKL